MSTLGFDKNIKNEIIVLSHLQNLSDGIGYSDYFGSTKELKKRSLRKYIKIDSKKIEELINKFINDKLKVYFTFENKLVIDKTKIYQIDGENLKIYDNKYIHKLFNIRLDCPRKEPKIYWGLYIHGPKIGGGLDIHGPKIDGGLDIHGPKIDGGLDIHRPKIGGGLNIHGPKIDGGLDIHGPKIGGGLNIHGPKIGGGLDIHRPKIGGDKYSEILYKIIHGPKIITDDYLYGRPYPLFPELEIPKLGTSNLSPKIEFPKKNINKEAPNIKINVDIEQSKSSIETILLFELENNDLIILCKDKRTYNIFNILIYRFENKEYFLFEIIKYQYRISIEKLMKNRFLVYVKGYEIYSLNKNNEYSLIIKENFPKSMNGYPKTYEINQSKYIFCSKEIYDTHQDIGIFEKYNIEYEYTE